jgi:two-component system sensor histidine kinase BaeS
LSLRWRIAIGFALVALATAAVIALAAPPIITQGFSDYDSDNDAGEPPVSAATVGPGTNDDNEGGAVVTQPPASSAVPGPNGQAEQTTIMRLILAAIAAASVASVLGLIGAGRLVRPLTELEGAAAGLARGDLTQRSGLAGRSDEFGQLGRTFDSMARQLEEAEETRRRFLQDAAHELKTPLAVIEATSSAIIDGVYEPEPRHIETMRDQARVLARIVDDLRTISLAEGGHLPLERRPLDVRSLLESVAVGFEARASAGSVHLIVDPAAAGLVDADPDRLRQMIGALVDNALRHTPPSGEIRLSAAAVSEDSATGQVPGRSAEPRAIRIVVADSGPGFPPEAVSRVFERFYQVDPSRSRGSATSGLGLSIVRALVEAHGGRAGAENRPDGGASIWVELPAVVSPDARVRRGRGHGATIGPTQPRSRVE